MIVTLFAGSMVAAAARPVPLEVDDVAPRWSVEADTQPVPTGPWWEAFGDGGLTKVVQQALEANPDLAAAQGRLKGARGARLVSLSPLLPGINGTLTTSGQPADTVFRCAVGPISPEEFGALQNATEPAEGLCFTGNALLNLNWTIDLFGQNILGYRAGVYEARASEGDLDAARLLISASATSAYLDVVSAQQQVDILQRQLQAQQELLEVIELRYESGSSTGLAVLQQRQQVAATQATIPLSRAAAESQSRALAALLGQGPTADLGTSAALPEPRATPSIGTPEQLIDRHPDLRAAHDRAIAARARKNAAWRSFLPSLSVNANAGYTYAAADEISSIEIWGIGGTLTVPVFNGGRAVGNLQSAQGTELATVRAYDSALLGAIRDVENAMVQEREQALRHQAVQTQVEAARQAYNEAQQRYLSGIDTFLNLLSAQATLQAAELSLVQAHRDRLGARVQLWTALGGTSAAGGTP